MSEYFRIGAHVGVYLRNGFGPRSAVSPLKVEDEERLAVDRAWFDYLVKKEKEAKK